MWRLSGRNHDPSRLPTHGWIGFGATTVEVVFDRVTTYQNRSIHGWATSTGHGFDLTGATLVWTGVGASTEAGLGWWPTFPCADDGSWEEPKAPPKLVFRFD
ncbi:hypothetical protein M513_09398 [Trichuris suis]|nr:hypothetical protein M513_09398 [Trichuris suis]